MVLMRLNKVHILAHNVTLEKYVQIHRQRKLTSIQTPNSNVNTDIQIATEFLTLSTETVTRCR